jgi:hypothetical protein
MKENKRWNDDLLLADEIPFLFRKQLKSLIYIRNIKIYIYIRNIKTNLREIG